MLVPWTWMTLLTCFLYSTWCQRVPFDPIEATVDSIHARLFARTTTCRDVVSSFLARIETHNHKINAVISLNPAAIQDAETLDVALASGNTTGSLFCVPIMLKDNYNAAGMPVTAGSLALKSAIPTEDAPSVKALKRAGAIILGKANMHEFALEGLTVSSLGGQTLNPYDFTRTPGGSSGGTGAAVAASFAVMGTGSDTVNSLRSPASANNLYSFRPTRGLISRTGVIPVGWTQDALGMIGRSLSDIAIALDVMSGTEHDIHDNATSTCPTAASDNKFAASISVPPTKSLATFRVGVLQGFFNGTASPENDPVNTLMAHIIALLARSGAVTIDIDDTKTYNTNTILSTMDLQSYEFREQLSSYLSKSDFTSNSVPRSMGEIFLNTSSFLVIPTQYSYIRTALDGSTSSAEYTRRLQRVSDLKTTLLSTFETQNLDAIIYPQQKNLVVSVGSPSQSGRNGILAALTGFPVVTIPIGFSNATKSAPIGIPVGMEIMGMPCTEAKLLQLARGLEKHLHARRAPQTDGLDESVEVTTDYDSVPIIEPAGLVNVDLTAYPLGVLRS